MIADPVGGISGSSARRRWARGFVAGGLLCLAACGGRQKPDTQPELPLEERRALQVIAQAVTSDGATPTPERDVTVGSGKTLSVDVGVEGHRYGIAYTHAAEREALGAVLPARSSPTQLQIAAGAGADAGARILVLQDTDYLYDDHLGTDYDSSTITAERRLGRDVHDFLVKARESRWP